MSTKKTPVLEAAVVIARILSVPRDRLGRLDFVATEEARHAREMLRVLAVRYKVPGAHDHLEQAANVLRAAIAASAE